jgi:hypothetical protein
MIMGKSILQPLQPSFDAEIDEILSVLKLEFMKAKKENRQVSIEGYKEIIEIPLNDKHIAYATREITITIHIGKRNPQ